MEKSQQLDSSIISDPFRFLKKKKNKPKENVSNNISIRHQSKQLQREYDPMKYYSKNAENYLKLVEYQPKKKTNNDCEIDKIKENTTNRENRFESIENIKIKSEPISSVKKVQERLNKKLDDNFTNIKEEENQLKIIQLEECEICQRKFNPESYQKHIKVCEKIFFKKRKQFSSEKQRSTSKDQKKS